MDKYNLTIYFIWNISFSIFDIFTGMNTNFLPGNNVTVASFKVCVFFVLLSLLIFHITDIIPKNNIVALTILSYCHWFWCCLWCHWFNIIPLMLILPRFWWFCSRTFFITYNLHFLLSWGRSVCCYFINRMPKNSLSHVQIRIKWIRTDGK